MRRAWTYWDLPPSLFNLPGGSWFDRSDISVNANYLNFTSDTMRVAGKSSLLGRIALRELANRGRINIGYITDTQQVMKAAQGGGTSWTYFTGNNSLSQARIWEWGPGSGTLFRHDVDHASVPIYDNAITGSDGGNWYDRFGTFPGAVESSTVSGNTLVLAQGTGRAYCQSGCGPNETPVLRHVFDHPAVFISRYNVNTWSRTSERWLWNPSFNFGFPQVQTACNGEVGITFVASRDNSNAVPIAGYLNEEQFVLGLTAASPHEAGDYYSLRPGRTCSSFVIPSRTREVDADGVTRTHWRYIEYGHGSPYQDRPPTVSIARPVNGRTLRAGIPVDYEAIVTDPQDGTVPPEAIIWRQDGTVIGRGSHIVVVPQAVGTHTVTVTATDGEGLSASAQIATEIVAATGPRVFVDSPADNSTFYSAVNDGPGEYRDVAFAARADNPDNPAAPLTYQWTDSINGGPAQVVSSQLSPVLRLRVEGHNCILYQHDLTLSVSNGTLTTRAQRRVNIRTVCIR